MESGWQRWVPSGGTVTGDPTSCFYFDIGREAVGWLCADFLEGIAAGERVVIRGIQRVRPDVEVTVQMEELKLPPAGGAK